MIQERREDIGLKVVMGIFSGVVMLLLSIFINAVWITANEGRNKAFEIGERVTAIESRFGGIQDDIKEIKELLKRKVPQL